MRKEVAFSICGDIDTDLIQAIPTRVARFGRQMTGRLCLDRCCNLRFPVWSGVPRKVPAEKFATPLLGILVWMKNEIASGPGAPLTATSR